MTTSTPSLTPYPKSIVLRLVCVFSDLYPHSSTCIQANFHIYKALVIRLSPHRLIPLICNLLFSPKKIISNHRLYTIFFFIFSNSFMYVSHRESQFHINAITAHTQWCTTFSLLFFLPFSAPASSVCSSSLSPTTIHISWMESELS